MKKILIITTLFLATTKLFAQDCSQYVYMQKGKTIESTAYNQAGKVMLKTVDYISDVSTTGGTTVAIINAESFDANGHSKSKRNITYKCNGGALLVDIASQSMNARASATYMEYPHNMHVGQHFDDMTMQLQTNMGSQTMNLTAKISNRTVVDKEVVTTPTGTWDALKITYTTTTTMDGRGIGPAINRDHTMVCARFRNSAIQSFPNDRENNLDTLIKEISCRSCKSY